MKSCCLPFLLYASEAVSSSAFNARCLDNCINRAIYKIFNVGSSECIQNVWRFLGLQELDTMIQERRSKFISRLICDGGFGILFLAAV